MKAIEYIQIGENLQKMTEEDFYTTMKEQYPSADKGYIDEKWVMFQSNPSWFVASRKPRGPGVALVEKIIQNMDCSNKKKDLLPTVLKDIGRKQECV